MLNILFICEARLGSGILPSPSLSGMVDPTGSSAMADTLQSLLNRTDTLDANLQKVIAQQEDLFRRFWHSEAQLEKLTQASVQDSTPQLLSQLVEDRSNLREEFSGVLRTVESMRLLLQSSGPGDAPLLPRTDARMAAGVGGGTDVGIAAEVGGATHLSSGEESDSGAVFRALSRNTSGSDGGSGLEKMDTD